MPRELATFGALLIGSTAAMGPPLPPLSTGYALSPAMAGKPTVELFLDLICPFSSKMWKSVYSGGPLEKMGDKVCFQINQVPQPWHPQGTYVHEAALAVKDVAPASYPAYVDAIYKARCGPAHGSTHLSQTTHRARTRSVTRTPPCPLSLAQAFDGGAFKDDSTWSKSRAQIYEELLDLCTATGIDRSAIASKLAMGEGGGNSGNAMTQHIKWAVKYHRCRGVHVTPTCHVNGLEAGIVSSGWTGEQWMSFLGPMGADNFQGTKL